MRICTTYGTPVPLRDGSDMHEIRLDVFGEIPEGIGEDDIITLCGKDIDTIPEGFPGLVDTGPDDIGTKYRRIRSFHDFESTPEASEIVSMLSDGGQEISKGAFAVNSFTDLHSIYTASAMIGRRHVLLGMGELGAVTRIRQRILGNEFTFGYCGEPTAPGQFSTDMMEMLGDGCSIAGVTGHPLAHTRSPAMQNAAIEAAGIDAVYLRFDSPTLDNLCDVMREYVIRGMNVTIPYKQDVFRLLDRVSDVCYGAGAVNTIINTDGVLTGDNTDVEGIKYAFMKKDQEPKGKKVLIMGSGGAARAAAYAFDDMGCSLSIAGRNAATVRDICDAFGCESHSGGVEGFDIVVNCTPIGQVEGQYPADLSDLEKDHTVFDMVYGRPTGLLDLAQARGCTIVDGSDMLVGQGAASFEMWFGVRPDTEVMRKAI